MPVEVTRRRREGARGGDARKVRRAIEVALEAEGAGARMVSLLLTDDREIHALNAQWRGKDKPTDVLAFAMREGDGVLDPGLLGDVVISVDTARRQQKKRGRLGLEQEIAFLWSHGLCHLLGYDHDDDDEEAEMNARMKQLADEGRRAGRTRPA